MMANPQVILLAAIVLISLSITKCSNFRMQKIQKLEEIEKMKAYKNGSIILYYKLNNKVTKRLEETLLYVQDELKTHLFRFRRLNCKKFTKVKECRTVDEAVVYMFKTGEQRTYDETELEGIDLAVNQILFFMANAHHDIMMDAANMEQAKEFVDINKEYLNTVVASFQDKSSEYLRRFLEVILRIRRQVAFLLVSGNQVDKSLYNKRGYFIRFYYSLRPSPGEEIKFVDISDDASTQKELNGQILLMNLQAEYTMHMAKLQQARKDKWDAEKKHQETVAEMKARGMRELQKKMSGEGGTRITQKSKELPDKQAKGKKEPVFVPRVKAGISEVEKDAFRDYWQERRSIFYGTTYTLTEDGLRDTISKVEGTANSILVVMFYVLWDTTFQLFEENYQQLCDEYKNDPNINIFQLDCSAWRTICIDYKINIFPTILVFKNGMTPFQYKGQLHADTITKHIKLWKEPFLPQLTEIRQVEDLTKQMKKMFMMGVFANDSMIIDVRQKEFETVALDYYGSIRIGIVIVKETEVMFNNKNHVLPIVISANANDVKGRITHTTELEKKELIGWINDQKREQVEQLTYFNFPSLVKIQKPFLISFKNKNKDLSPLQKFSKRFSELITVWMDEDCPLTEYIMESYKVRKNGSKIIILDKIKNKVYEYKDGKRTIGDVTNWVKKCLGDMNETQSHPLTDYEEVIKEKGYDFLFLEDNDAKERAAVNAEEDKEEVKEEEDKEEDDDDMSSNDHYTSEFYKDNYTYLSYDKEMDEKENNNAVYEHYKSLNYRPDIREHDEF